MVKFKNVFTLGVALVTSIAVGVTDVQAAPRSEAVTSKSATAVEIEAATQTQQDVFIDTFDIDEGQVHIGNGVVVAPVSNAGDLTVTLPVQSIDEFGVPSGDANTDFSLEVRDEGDGSFRSLIHMPDVDSPREFEFAVDQRFKLIALEDEGVAVRDESGNLAGTFSAPWAVDASGAEVATDYVIRGNSLIQRVHANSSTNFPVVADPFWIPALMVVGHLTRHAITQAAARGVSHALIRQVVQNGVKTSGKRGTSVFTQGKGKNRIRVIVDNRTGNIITVTKG